MATEANSLLAAVLSLFIPGLGQVYKGHILMGIIWFLILGGGYYFASISIGIGGPIAFILLIICVIQAYRM